MEPNKVADNILSIECAVAGGSVAVLRGDSSFNASTDTSNASRAEEILTIVEETLRMAEVTLSDIDLIAVSIGPGSYSGIRIGMATAAGLSAAGSVPCAGVSVLDALTLRAPDNGHVITAIPVGKHDIAHRSFEIGPKGPPVPLSPAVLQTEDTFLKRTVDFESSHLVCHSDVVGRVAGRLSDFISVLDAGTNMADLVGRFARAFPEETSMRPLYLRNQKFTAESAGF